MRLARELGVCGILRMQVDAEGGAARGRIIATVVLFALAPHECCQFGMGRFAYALVPQTIWGGAICRIRSWWQRSAPGSIALSLWEVATDRTHLYPRGSPPIQYPGPAAGYRGCNGASGVQWTWFMIWSNMTPEGAKLLWEGLVQ